MVLVDDGGDEVRAAGVGAGLDQNGVDIALDDTGHQGPQNFAGSVFRGIGEGAHVHVVQNQQGEREGDDIDHAPERQGLADLQIAPQGQRHVDDQA